MSDVVKIFFKRIRVAAFFFLIADLFVAVTSFSQTVVVNPTSPWTVPAGVTSIKVEVWGGGGGGGGSFFGAGGGGGGGAYNVATFPVTPGHTFTITIGSGGSSGNGGGTTTVNGVDGTVSANGGGAGGFGIFGNGGAGTSATGVHNGGAGGASGGNGAGGGGGAGNNGDGTDGSNTGNGSGGSGNPNSTPYIGGNGGAARTTNGTGNNAGTGPGGGGGGARNTGGSSSGGTGGPGQVVITYSACSTITASAAKLDLKCFGVNEGEITITGSGGTSPYMFSIDNVTNYNATVIAGASYVPINGTSGKFINLPIGTYKIRVKDNNGCESKAVQ